MSDMSDTILPLSKNVQVTVFSGKTMADFPQFLIHESGNSLVKINSDYCYILVTIYKEYKKEDCYLYQVRQDAPGEIFDLKRNRYWKPTSEANFERARKEMYDYLSRVQQAIKNKTPF